MALKPHDAELHAELGTLLINLSRNAVCPDDSVKIGNDTMTVEQCGKPHTKCGPIDFFINAD